MIQTVELPNGMRVRALNRLDPPVLYHEIFATRTYEKHGITLSDGNCVFDVGANIGLYSIALARELRGLRLFLFEPIPEIFTALKQNAANHLGRADVQLLNVGLGQCAGSAWFQYDRNLSIAASAHARSVSRAARGDVRFATWASACVRDLERIGQMHPHMAALLLAALAAPVLQFAAVAMFAAIGLALALRSAICSRRVKAQLQTLSDAIRIHAVQTIDLVKIDVEGAELDVVLGIKDADWPKIRQFVVEAHDVDGRVDRLRAIFERHGYHTTIDQEDWSLHPLLGIYTLYALRAPEQLHGNRLHSTSEVSNDG
jgi:31-O-methyltransferase